MDVKSKDFNFEIDDLNNDAITRKNIWREIKTQDDDAHVKFNDVLR